MTAEEIKQRFGAVAEMIGGGLLNLKPGQHTDDTSMMLCIAESLVENKGYNPDDIARRFVEWYGSNPPNIGKTTRTALAKIADGVPWRIAGDKERPTNGSVMRCPPIGLMYFLKDSNLTLVSVETSIMTHAHPDAIRSCILINTMIASIVYGETISRAFDRALSAIRMWGDDFYWKLIDGLLRPSGLDPNGPAIGTALLAIKHLAAADSFEEAVISAVNCGGDTDTIAAVTGALAGAYYGISAIPERWSSKLNPYSAQKIKEIADGILELAIKGVY